MAEKNIKTITIIQNSDTNNENQHHVRIQKANIFPSLKWLIVLDAAKLKPYQTCGYMSATLNPKYTYTIITYQLILFQQHICTNQ